MRFSNKILSQTLVHLCVAKGIKHIVISPGSRNAPLIIGFTSHPNFTNYSIVDERCAAFFALGIAQQLQAPVALVCSSGSALLNYYPAIAEAFYSDIPLLVFSADRPAHLVEVGDGQTIQQEQVFGKHVLYHANCKEGEEHQRFNETELNIALNTAIELNGPVHINLPFSEPLYQTVERTKVQPQQVPARGDMPQPGLDDDTTQLLDTWNNATKRLILVGVLYPNSIEQAQIDFLANDPNTLVLTETTSNLNHSKFITAIDQLISTLSEKEFTQLQPEVLITFGGMVISKRIKAFLRKFQPAIHWHIDPKKAYDTYFCLQNHSKTTPNEFLKVLKAHTVQRSGTYQHHWLQVKSHRLRRHNEYMKQIPFSDLKVFAAIFKQLPEAIQLQLANSATVRYAQLFDIAASIEVFCNRGTSGIDGSTSTAVGAAVSSDKQTVFITGDLSFLYDSNALWNTYIPKDFRIIIINNSGGGIFRILPGAKESDHFSTYFETQHSLTAQHLCTMYEIGYDSASTETELKEKLAVFFDASERAQVLEVFTPPTVNDTILIDYFKFIA